MEPLGIKNQWRVQDFGEGGADNIMTVIDARAQARMQNLSHAPPTA